MSKLSHDQKRKKKLEERKRRAQANESLAYHGGKYKIEELAPLWLQTEAGIYEAFVLTGRVIHDRVVAEALTTLILRLRSEPLNLTESQESMVFRSGEEKELVIQLIRDHWAKKFSEDSRPPKDDFIGVLRTCLGTLEDHREVSPQPRGYLRYIEQFLTRKVGLEVNRAVYKPAPPAALAVADPKHCLDVTENSDAHE